MSCSPRVACLAFAAALAGPAVLAQAPPPVPLLVSARDIHVHDGWLAGATFIVTSNLTGFTMTLVTGEDGTAIAPPLMPGSYTISVSMPGYGRLVARNFCIEPGGPAEFRAGLGRDDRPSRLPLPSPVDPSLALTPQPMAAIDTMSPAEIRDAIAFGRASTKIAAPPLGGRRMGRIFTPFYRIATVTQVAQATGKHFTESEIPTLFVHRLAWIVGDAIEHDVQLPDTETTSRLVVAVSDIAIRPKGANDAAYDIHPAWKIFLTTWCDQEAMSSMLGRQFPLPSAVAAFPMDALQPGNTILFTYSTFAATGRFRGVSVPATTRRVKIGEGDLRKWNKPGR